MIGDFLMIDLSLQERFSNLQFQSWWSFPPIHVHRKYIEKIIIYGTWFDIGGLDFQGLFKYQKFHVTMDDSDSASF